MKREFNFNELIKFSNFSKTEEEILCNLNNQVGDSLTFKIDNSIETAKFNYVKNEINLKKINDYSSLIHELLHAELIIFHKFPTIKDINEILITYSQLRLKNLIATLTNDVHHFIFYNKFKRATKHKESIYLVSNQKRILESNFSNEYLEKKYNQQGTNLNKVLFYYKSIFIINTYKVLLKENTTSSEKLMILDAQLYKIFNNFFTSILALNYEYKESTTRTEELLIYTTLIKKIKTYLI